MTPVSTFREFPVKFVHQLFLLLLNLFSQRLMLVVIGDHFSNETTIGFLQRKWVHRANGQTPRDGQHHHTLKIRKGTYGGLLVRSVFKMIGTLVISRTS